MATLKIRNETNDGWYSFGAQGTQGYQGAQGTQGTQGVAGSQGNQGNQGSQGTQGNAGTQGTQGYQGASGSAGAQGNQGNQGSQGSAGAQGTQGTQGASGAQGNQGNQGNQGTQGATGAQGSQGTQGNAGAQGASGSQGNQGNQGTQGSAGSQGAQGTQGNSGAAGAQGNQGNQGNQGSQGNAGAQGTQGTQGNAGAQGNQGNQGNQGAQGTQGRQGYQGTQGNAGAQGNQGNQGNQGSQGTQGNAGAQGTQGNAGAQGNQGNQGNQGTQGRQGYQGTQGNAGAQGNQGNQGTQGASSTSVTLVDAGADTTTWVVLGTAQTGSVSPATDAGLTYNASTNALTATTFVGALNGNANTVTAADESADTTCFPFFGTAASGSLPLKTNANLTFNASTGALAATTVNGLSAAQVTDLTDGGTTILHTHSLPIGIVQNYQLAVSVASNNLTVAIKGMDGNDPSASNPVTVRIGNTNQTLTAALSVTANAGTAWMSLDGRFAAKEQDLFVYLVWNTNLTPDAIDVMFSRLPHCNVYGEFSTTNTNEKYAVINGTAPAATDDCINIGRFAATLSAGASYNWSVPTFTTTNLIQRPIFETRWRDWLPTYSGSASLTFTSVTTQARYKLISDLCFISLSASGTTGGTASTTLRGTLPFESANSAYNIGAGGTASEGAGLAEAGQCFIFAGTPDTISVKKYNNANWGLGAGRVITASIGYQIE